MSKALALIISLLGGFVFVGIIFVIYWIFISNNEIRLRNRFDAVSNENRIIYDNVWKTISQQAQVTDQYKEGFKEVWANIMSGKDTNSRSSALQVFVNRINPKFDSDLYKKLMNTIEAQRKEFLSNQKKLISVKQEHDNMRTTFPNSLVCGNRPELVLTLITSSNTEEIFEHGKEDNINVFPKKQ